MSGTSTQEQTEAKTKTSTAVASSVAGVVKPGCGESPPVRVTGGPAVWVQAKCRGAPWGSALADPSRITGSPGATVWSGPACGIGTRFRPQPLLPLHSPAGGAGSRSNVAVHALSASIVTWTVPFAPAASPLHPTKTDPAAGTAADGSARP